MPKWKRRILEKLGWHFVVFQDCQMTSYSHLVAEGSTFVIEQARVDIAEIVGTPPNHPRPRNPLPGRKFDIVEVYPPGWYMWTELFFMAWWSRLKRAARGFIYGSVAHR